MCIRDRLHNELFLKVDIQGVPLMHDALAVFAVRSRRNPAIALRRQQHTVTGGGKSRLLCRRLGFSGKRRSTQSNRFLRCRRKRGVRSRLHRDGRRRDDSIRFRDSRRRHSRRGRFFPTHRIAGKSGDTIPKIPCASRKKQRAQDVYKRQAQALNGKPALPSRLASFE